MLVRQEDVPQCREGHVSKDELSRDAVAAIDDVRSAVADDDLGGRRTRLSWPRTATCPEKDQSGFPGLRFAGVRARRGGHKGSGASEKTSPVHSCLHAK